MSQSCATGCSDCFRTLADRTRLKILRAVQRHPANVAEITEAMNVTQPTVSYHLKLLEGLGMLVKEKRGREMYYAFNPQYPCKNCGVFSAPIKI